MVTTKRGFVLGSCILSGAAAIISLVALGTQEWILANALVTDSTDVTEESPINIGLFGGTFNQNYSSVYTFQISIVCAFDLNVCAYLCGDNMENDLRTLMDGRAIDVNDACVSLPSASRKTRSLILRASKSSQDETYLNAGAWISTVIFLIISLIVGLFTAILSLWNTVANPYQVYFTIFALYIYNSIAFCTLLVAIVVWGTVFATNLMENIPMYQTLANEFTTEDRAELGYSYWINLISLFCYLGSMALLYFRDYLISKEPKKTLDLEESTDPVIYLY